MKVISPCDIWLNFEVIHGNLCLMNLASPITLGTGGMYYAWNREKPQDCIDKREIYML